MKLIIAIWLAATLILFGVFATRGTYGLFGTGANSWSIYGWPGGWLSRNQYQTFSTNEDGEMIQTEYWVKWYVSDWAMLSVSVVTSVAVPALFLSPCILSRKKHTQPDQFTDSA
ncbi:MAG: hypothetical protein PF795_01995 [Kiritimatiellae bacterium]|jgi:hypothetical protein|nr:hypothetical protein [Kiritimatiellia bacterium]